MKFTIRELFLVTMIVALAVGWWLDRNHLDSKRLLLQAENDYAHYERDFWEEKCDEMARRLRERGWTVELDPDKVKPGESFMKEPDPPTSQAPAPNPPNP
jgi:hypothetical protein